MKILDQDLPLFPLNTVLFPQGRIPLQIFEPRYIEMIDRCLEEDLAFGVVLIKEGAEVGGPAVPRSVGTLARIVDVAHLDDGHMNLTAAGISRFKIVETSTDLPYMTAQIEVWRDENVDIRKSQGVANAAAKMFQEYVSTIQNIAAVEAQTREEKWQAPKDPTLLSYIIATNLQVSQADKQSLLETPTTVGRLSREIAFMGREIELIRLISDRSDRVLDQGTFSLN